MIKIDNVRNVNLHSDAENLLIVRSLKNTIKNARQEALLSPSSQLFYDYLAWKNAGEWDEKCFLEQYVPRFLAELKENTEAIALLNKLYTDSFNKNIVLYCFCPNERLCHRSIVAGLLLGAGANISCDNAYRKYWEMWQNL